MTEEQNNNDEDFEDLEKLFEKIENLKGFTSWFGVPCSEFVPLCGNCKFWLKWNKLKEELFEEYFQ